MLHEQLVGILLLHPSEHDATPWFLQPGLKGCSAHPAVHFLRDQNASQLPFTDMPPAQALQQPQYPHNEHTSSLMLKLIMSNNMVSI